MLDSFDDIRFRELILFDRLARLGTITAAAKELGIPKPTASRWLASLEERAGRPLFSRGTRRSALTDAGRAFHAELQPLLRAAGPLRAVAGSADVAGTLRVSVPVPLGRLLGGAVIAAFMRRLPSVRLEVLLRNERVDLLRDRVDLALRGGPLTSSDLIARHLATVPMWLYASAAPLEPDRARPLVAAQGDEALLARTRPELLPAAVVVDDRSAVRDALCEGLGVGVLPGFLGEPARRQGLLTRVDEQPLSTTPLHAVFLPEQRRDARLRTLIEIIEAQLLHQLGVGSSGGSSPG